MQATEKSRPGPKVKPAAVKRTEWLKVRCSPLELETIRARSQEAGLTVSEHVRRRAGEQVFGLGTALSRRPSREAGGAGSVPPSGAEPGDSFERRVAAKMQSNGVPRRSAEILVKREMAREQA